MTGIWEHEGNVENTSLMGECSQMYGGNVEINNKTRFFYVLYSDKTCVFDQSERAQGPIYIMKFYN